MIILKQVIQYTTTNGLEATWVDRTVAPATTDEEGNEVPEVVTDIQVKCHSYDGTQMQMFRDDAAAFGTPLDDYEDMIANIESKIVPYVPPPPVVPTVVSMRQARLALNAAGLLGQVEAAVASSTEDVRIEWQYSSEIRRDWPTLVLLAGALGLTDAQLDALFAQAATL